jgi:pimeloyl-ACP methyl ester carboxylesterase
VLALDHLTIPIWREGLMTLERAALSSHPVWRGEGVPRGTGEPVLLIPGFLAGDISLGPMAQWLRRIGYRPCRPGIRVNVDCTTRAVERLEEQLEELAERHRRGVMIIGQSRGGAMARILAVRRPDLIDRIVCLGSPLVDQFAVHPFVRLQVRAVALLGSMGVQGVFSHGCRDGCCAQANADLRAPFPDAVLFTSIYSRRDGIVDWRSCLDPGAGHVEVDSTHCGMSVNHAVFTVVAAALAARRTSDAAPGDEDGLKAARAA